MSKVSAAFGEIIKNFLKEHKLTFRAAAFKSGLSAAYWKDMSDGRVPSEQVITQIAQCFDDLDENELRLAGSYALNPDKMDLVQAVDFAMRRNQAMPDEGKKQIIDFVKKIQKRYAAQDTE